MGNARALHGSKWLRLRNLASAMLCTGTIDAPAKINLTLEILARRADGYHGVRSVMLPIGLFDVLRWEPAPRFAFSAGDGSPPGEDNLVLRAVRALAKSGARVPDDCSVIGFDDVAAATLSTPSLTTIRQPMESMGAMAVGILVDSINASQESREFSAAHERVAPELVVRESTRALR